jgi:Mrp family chromosome partitioning ATPase
LREALTGDSATPARTASIERLFTNLAKPALRSIESTLPQQRSVSASETLGISRPIYRADPGPATAPLTTAPTPPAAIVRPAPVAAAAADQETARPSRDAVTLFAMRNTLDYEPVPVVHMADTGVVPPPHLNRWPAETEQPLYPGSMAAVEEPVVAAVIPQPWRPMLQVEHFLWPKICAQLHMVAVRQMDQLADAIANAVGGGHKVIAVGGCRAGDGATTLSLCAARQLARRGLRVVVVDGSFNDPQVATRLGLLPQHGWEDVLAGKLPLEEVIVDSTEDRLAVLPVVRPQSGMDGLFQQKTTMAASLDTLSQHYDVVLIDAGALEDRLSAWAPGPGNASRLDGAVLVHNLRAINADRLAEVGRGLAAAAVVQVGVIQNFTRS